MKKILVIIIILLGLYAKESFATQIYFNNVFGNEKSQFIAERLLEDLDKLDINSFITYKKASNIISHKLYETLNRNKKNIGDFKVLTRYNLKKKEIYSIIIFKTNKIIIHIDHINLK